MTAPGVFVETSAQFCRLVGAAELKESTNAVIRDAKRLATSEYVWDEFHSVVDSTYGAVYRAVEAATAVAPRRPVKLTELTKSVRRKLGPRPPGGSLSHDLLEAMVAKFGDRRVPPQLVVNFVKGQRVLLVQMSEWVNHRRWSEKEILTGCSCCSWAQTRIGYCPVQAGTGACALAKLLSGTWEDFKTCVDVVRAKRGLVEGKRLSALFPNGIDEGLDQVLPKVLDNPNAFGDVLIFLEVPQGWEILTRDRAHELLTKKGPRQVALKWIRPVRFQRQEPITIERDGTSVQGTTVNVSMDDVLVHVEEKLWNLNWFVDLESPAIGGARQAKTVRARKLEDGGFHVAFRFRPTG